MARKRKRARGGATLLCRKCKVPTRVVKTRRNDHNVIQRERHCPSCGAEIHSVEKETKA